MRISVIATKTWIRKSIRSSARHVFRREERL